MAKPKEPLNWFYIPLLASGVVFFLTACAYGVMVYRGTRTDLLLAGETAPGGLLTFLDERGMQLMGIELAVLALATIGTIGLDRWRWNRGQNSAASPGESTDTPAS